MLALLLLSLASAEDAREVEPYVYKPRVFQWAPEDCSPERLDVLLPRSGVAMGLAGVVGFGAGSYYTHHLEAGATFTVLDVAGLVVTAVGAGLFTDEPRPSAIGVGSGILGLSRMIQVGVAPRQARQSGMTILKACHK